VGRDPRTVYTNELDLLNGFIKLITGEERGPLEASAFGILPKVKEHFQGDLKIKTVKICFILDNDVHMHKDIDWEDL
jgi:hypothetical protein